MADPNQQGAEESERTANGVIDNERNESTISFEEIMYSSSSYRALVKPVTLTMILAALAVTFVTTPSNKRMMEESMSHSYTVFDVSDNTDSGDHHRSNAGKLGLSLVNGLVMVSVIAALTFGIVLLYKYRCMKCLLGYMILSSAALLGLLGGLIFDVFIERHRIPIDIISFYFILFNFAVVGTVSIFYQKGIPMFMTQTYLVFTSVILAWQLSHLDSWTTWTLLVFLALYDLCAVLTPCGPLKFLVKLMSQDDAPDMPGLLYEANLPAGVERPGRQNINNNENGNSNAEEVDVRRVGSSASADVVEERGSVRHGVVPTNAELEHVPPSSPIVTTSLISNRDDDYVGEEVLLPNTEQGTFQPICGLDVNVDETLPTIPLAIALIYRLEIISPECYATAHQNHPLPRQGLSPSQLRAHVEVRFPTRGGKIIPSQDTAENNGGSPLRRCENRIEVELKYTILDRHGNIKRTLVVDEEGRVFQETGSDSNNRRQNESGDKSSIRLGLVCSLVIINILPFTMSHYSKVLSFYLYRVISYSTLF